MRLPLPLISCASLSTFAHASPRPEPVIDAYRNTVAHGQYRIGNSCGENVSAIADRLDYLRSIIPAVLVDVERNPPSRAYQTFFKARSYGPYVRRILASVQFGEPRRFDSQFLSPVLICANQPGELTYTVNGVPEDLFNGGSLCEHKETALYFVGTPFIGICPHFWTIPSKPQPIGDPCLLVNTAINRFQATRAQQYDFVNFQVYNLAGSLLHFYILASGKVTFENLPNQIYVDRVVYETAFESSLNGWSYVWYIENVRARCVSFPTDPRHRVEPIELLELDSNSTAATGGANAAPAFKNDTLLDAGGAGVISGAQALYEEGIEVFAKTNMTKKRKL